MSETNRLRVATFNLKHGASRKGYLGRPERVAAACAALDVDILALQEVDRFVWRSLFADLFTAAAGDTYTDSYFGKATGANLIGLVNPGGQYGNALLVKGEILEKKVVSLRGDYVRLAFGKRRNIAPEPRNAIVATVRTQYGHEISVANMHIGGQLRQQYIGAIATEVASPSGPSLLMGDFNTGRDNMIEWLAESSSLELAPCPPEISESYKQVDHIATDGLDILRVSAHWFNFSDHPAIVAESGVVTS